VGPADLDANFFERSGLTRYRTITNPMAADDGDEWCADATVFLIVVTRARDIRPVVTYVKRSSRSRGDGT